MPEPLKKVDLTQELQDLSREDLTIPVIDNWEIVYDNESEGDFVPSLYSHRVSFESALCVGEETLETDGASVLGMS